MNNNAYVDITIGDNHFQYSFGASADFDETTPIADGDMSPTQLALTVALADAFVLAKQYIEKYGEMPEDEDDEEDFEEEEDWEIGCGDSYCHICGDPGDLFDDLEEEDDDE